MNTLKTIIVHLRRGLAFLAAALVVCACIFDNESLCVEPDQTLVVLHVSPLSTRATEEIGSSSYHEVSEMVKSFRVFIVNEAEDGQIIYSCHWTNGGTVTSGENFDESGLEAEVKVTTPESARDFVGAVTFRAHQGNYGIYFIANEESVPAIQCSGNLVGPDGQALSGTDGQAPSLTQLLDAWSVPASAADGEAGRSGADFKKLINQVYFAPDYNNEEIWNAGEVYLPYTSYYPLVIGENDLGTRVSPTMYMVPVATKFEFHFTNNRTHDVEISGVSIGKFDDKNYLLAQVGSGDLQKKLPDGGTEEGIYWPNWLAEVSKASWEYSGSSKEFGDKYGWISAYSLPANTIKTTTPFQENGGKWTVPASTTPEGKTAPGTFSIGPYYFPESWNEYTYTDPNTNKAVTIQRYGLNMTLHDINTDRNQDPVFDDNPIETIGSLFRNTYVIIHVVMNEGESGIYAQIEPWEYQSGSGYAGDYVN